MAGSCEHGNGSSRGFEVMHSFASWASISFCKSGLFR